MTIEEVGSTVLTWAVWLAFGLLLTGMALALARLVLGPTMPDRVVALDLVAILAVGFMGVFAIAAGQAVFLDVAITLALVGFLGTVAFARYAEHRSRRGGGGDIDD